MKRAILWLFTLAILAALAGAALFFRAEQAFKATPFGAGTRVVLVPQGTSAKSLARLLAGAGVVSSERAFYWHLRWFRKGAHVRAGEYEFAGPLKPDDVLGKLVRGEIKLYHFTVAEGLRVDEIARVIGQTGLCDGAELLRIARDPASPKKYGVPGPSLEGYLFPDTYSVARMIGCGGIVQAMVSRYRRAFAQASAQRDPSVKLDERETVTLASIVEKETAQPEERPRVSCVFHNRLRKGIPLGTDPTVVYSILLAQDFKWDGNIHKSDLSRESPYNTYRVKGLPPGPIANPGQAALDAALRPLECSDLFFVSRNDRTHVFCPDLKCHEANVRKWQVEYFRKKRGG